MPADPALLQQEKHDLRQRMRAQRRSLSAAQQRRAAHCLSLRLRALPEIRRARRVALYLPNDGEISLEIFCNWLWQQHVDVYLPRVRAQTLHFHRFDRGTALRKNHFGIPEPVGTRKIDAHNLDVVAMPLVAFDQQGRRLGMGGGFYDRRFAFKRRNRWKKPRLVGCAHACQQASVLPVAGWDIPLDCVVTDKQTTRNKSH